MLFKIPKIPRRGKGGLKLDTNKHSFLLKISINYNIARKKKVKYSTYLNMDFYNETYNVEQRIYI